MTTLPGLHHVTAICSDPQKNIDFYCGILGLRLVKLTVNFDDPASYHLYYGDELGRPGTILTFFAWPKRRARPHWSAAGHDHFFCRAHGAAIDYWTARLKERGIATEHRPTRFGEPVLAFADPDGLSLEIVAAVESTEPKGQPWAAGPVPVQHAIRGFHSVTISEEGYESTAKLLDRCHGLCRPSAASKIASRYRAA